MFDNKNMNVKDWVQGVAEMTKPDKVVWITGEESQLEALRKEACESGELIKLNQEKLPGCYLHRTDVRDVARVEDRTFICTSEKDNAGPTNNWMDPKEMYDKLYKIATGSMQGRTMYVIPFSMGVVGSPFAKYGVEVTDSIYVVLNMHIMTRIGNAVLDDLGDSSDFTKCLHCKDQLDPEKRYISHFPEDNTIISVNSGYGGNVLLGKKCLALRIASYLGKQESWMAEHMLILGIENPQGQIRYVAAAFPSACGKTNLAMLVPPKAYVERGWKIYCVGDDIAWLRVADDGRLWAINPENGFFGVAPEPTRNPIPMPWHPQVPTPSSQTWCITWTITQFGGSVWTRTHLQTQLTGREILGTARNRRNREHIPTPDLPHRQSIVPSSLRSLTAPRACPFPPSSSAAVVQRQLLWCTSPEIGITACSWDLLWRRKPLRQPQAL